MTSITPDQLESAKSETRGLKLDELKTVARAARVAVSGPKALLQSRISDKLTTLARYNYDSEFQRLKALIENPSGPLKIDPAAMSQVTQQVQKTAVASGSAQSLAGIPQRGRFIFKESPFYIIQQALTPVHELKVRESTRDQLEFGARVPHDFLARVAQGENLRVMIYCAAEPPPHSSKVDIAFPTQIEIKVNGNELKTNLRGIKQRPGSTRPADITDLVHKRQPHENELAITYALTSKKYSLVVNLVRQVKPEILVAKLKERRPISKQQVVNDMIEKAQDSDIQATSSIMSLKCPISTLRIGVPARSSLCKHIQCFDALSYFQLQEQAPTWTCPRCNASAPYDTIQIDEYVEEILASTSESTEQVALEPDGVWSEVDTSRTNGNRESSSEDDLIEISEMPRVSAIKNEASQNSMLARTPSRTAREESATSSTVQRSGTGKRPAAVIDLTLSDDDEPVRPVKRRALDNDSNDVSPRPQDTDFSSDASGISFSVSRQGTRPGSSFGF